MGRKLMEAVLQLKPALCRNPCIANDLRSFVPSFRFAECGGVVMYFRIGVSRVVLQQRNVGKKGLASTIRG